MTFLRKLLFATALGSIGCGSEDAPDETRVDRALDDREVLAACGLPVLCPELVHTVYPSDPACVLPYLRDREPILARLRFLADGGDCTTEREVHSGGDGVAVVWQLTRGADCQAAYSLERCPLRPPSFFADCLAAGHAPTVPTDCTSEWFEACTPLEAPECPP